MVVNVVKLGDVATISAGQSAPKSNYFCEEGIPFVRAGSLEFLERGESIDLCEKISEDNAQICRLKLYPKNSILFAKSGMSANKGRIYKLERSAYIVRHLAIITPDETKLIPEYLMYWLQKHPPKTLIKDESYPSIGLTDIANMEIELPPLDKQKKIAKILDKADEIRAKKKLANDKLDEFLKSTFITMFGNISNKTTLSQYITTLSAGKSLAGEEECENKVLNTSSVTWDRFDKNQYKNYPLDYIPQEEHKVRIGDVIISRMNTPALVGTVGYVWDVDDNIYLPDRLWKANITDKVNPIFLWQLLIQPSTKIEIQKIATGTSGSMKNISKEKILKLSVLDVAIEEQNKFAKIVEKVEAQKQKNELVIEQMNNLFNSLSQRAFKGEI